MRQIFIVILLTLGLAPGLSRGADGDASSAKFEIRKFRFKRHDSKNFERLVIEFSRKDKMTRAPEVKSLSANAGKEANVVVEQALLVGAIPEALINDSYVSRSKFLGPISINTDGPNTGFSIRTFLKEAVSVDAFWLNNPSRLVVDVFPANSPRVEGRLDENFKEREVAAVKPKADRDPIVCYPVSAAVSATVSFSQNSAHIAAGPGGLPYSNMSAGGPEPVICFLASSQVYASVAFKPKSPDYNNYVQWDPMQGHGPAQAQSGFPRMPQSLPGMMGGMGGMPGLPTPPPMNQPAVPPMLQPSGGPQSSLPPAPNAAGGNRASLVVPDVAPGRTQLGQPLIPPSQVQRMPGANNPPRLPSSFGEAPASGAPTTKASMAPPVK